MRFLLILIILPSPYKSLFAQKYFIDDRDSIRYEVFQVNKSFWFKGNLKFVTPTSWCSENPDSRACMNGNYYYPTDLINICPGGWRVPTWREYKKAIKYIEEYYGLTDSVQYVESKVPLYKDLNLDSELVVGLTLLGDSSFFDMVTTGWIQGDEWQPKDETTLWIVHDISNTPQPHIHVRNKEIVMHSHGHHVLDKPKKLRRFAVRCISDVE